MENARNELKRGTIVERIEGYPMLGEIRGVVTTSEKNTRYIVENLLAPGQLLIFTRSQFIRKPVWEGMTYESIKLGYITNLIARIVKQPPARKRKPVGILDKSIRKAGRIAREVVNETMNKAVDDEAIRQQLEDDRTNAGHGFASENPSRDNTND